MFGISAINTLNRDSTCRIITDVSRFTENEMLSRHQIISLI